MNERNAEQDLAEARKYLDAFGTASFAGRFADQLVHWITRCASLQAENERLVAQQVMLLEAPDVNAVELVERRAQVKRLHDLILRCASWVETCASPNYALAEEARAALTPKGEQQ